MKKSAYSLLCSALKNEENGHTIFDQSKQRFISAVKWNVVESLLYHGIFIGHQLGLYSYIGAQEYGKVGALFGFSFLCVTLLLGALDSALIPYVQLFTSSKKRFTNFIKKYLVPQCLFMLCAPLFLVFIKTSGLFAITHQFSWGTTLLLGLFIGCEAVKKLLRHILQLMFHNRSTATVEVIGIFGYVILFWSAVFLGTKPTTSLFIVPFIVTSLFSLVFLVYLFYLQHQSLKDSSENTLELKGLRITQIYAYINQISRSLFSSNFLVPLFALSSGFMQAGVAALVNYSTHTLTFLVHKICIPTAAAFFGHTVFSTKKEQQDSFVITIKLFFFIVTLLFSVFALYGWINISNLSQQTLFYALFFFAVHILEHLFTLYEKFFIAQNKTATLSIINITSCLISGYAFWIIKYNTFLGAVLISFTLRVMVIVLLSYIIFSSKNIPFVSFFIKKHPKTTST